MLSVQYRMHPAISAFPSKRFYEGNLKDWEGIVKAAVPPIPYYQVPIFKPVVFFSLDSEESQENTSKVNRDEVAFICQFLEFLRCMVSQQQSTTTTSQFMFHVRRCSIRIIQGHIAIHGRVELLSYHHTLSKLNSAPSRSSQFWSWTN